MRINGFRCDACGQEHLIDPTIIVQNYRQAMPAQWIMLSQNGNADEPWLFCSWHCLREWLAGRITREE